MRSKTKDVISTYLEYFKFCNEELKLNYRLSNSERRPRWYTPVDEEEDEQRCN